MIAKSLGGTGRARLNEYRHPGKQQGKKVSYIVTGFREQSQAVCPDSSKQRNQHVRKSSRKRIAQGSGAQRWVRMRVLHSVSLPPIAVLIRVYPQGENLSTYFRTSVPTMSILLAAPCSVSAIVIQLARQIQSF